MPIASTKLCVTYSDYVLIPRLVPKGVLLRVAVKVQSSSQNVCASLGWLAAKQPL